MKTTKEKFAEMITGREYPFEISAAERATASISNLLVIYGSSDDLCKIDGLQRDETGAPGTVHLSDYGCIMPIPDRYEVGILKKFGFFYEYERRLNHAIQVELKFDPGHKYTWLLSCETDHATFEIVEDGKPFCRGIVIDLLEASL